MNMETITDDQTESLLAFVRLVARLKLYGSEMERDISHGDDAIESMDDLISQARELIGE